jgi:hypothetical protein
MKSDFSEAMHFFCKSTSPYQNQSLNQRTFVFCFKSGFSFLPFIKRYKGNNNYFKQIKKVIPTSIVVLSLMRVCRENLS